MRVITFFKKLTIITNQILYTVHENVQIYHFCGGKLQTKTLILWGFIPNYENSNQILQTLTDPSKLSQTGLSQ